MSNEEMLEIFNEDGTSTGIVKPRSEVHKMLTDWHKVTAIFIINPEGNYLIHQISLAKERNRGLWTHNFGGHITYGETIELNCVRELSEEIGINVRLEALKYIGSQNFESVRHIDCIYEYRYEEKDGPFNPRPEEVATVKWLTPAELVEISDKDGFAFRLYDVVRDALVGSRPPQVANI